MNKQPARDGEVADWTGFSQQGFVIFVSFGEVKGIFILWSNTADNTSDYIKKTKDFAINN